MPSELHTWSTMAGRGSRAPDRLSRFLNKFFNSHGESSPSATSRVPPTNEENLIRDPHTGKGPLLEESLASSPDRRPSEIFVSGVCVSERFLRFADQRRREILSLSVPPPAEEYPNIRSCKRPCWPSTVSLRALYRFSFPRSRLENGVTRHSTRRSGRVGPGERIYQ